MQDLEQLTAFGHGKLREADDEQIADHEADCKLCRSFLDTLPDDDQLALIRSLLQPSVPPSESSQRGSPSVAPLHVDKLFDATVKIAHSLP
jgi:hypothetical protein